MLGVYSPIYTIGDLPEFPDLTAYGPRWKWTKWNSAKTVRTVNIPSVGSWVIRFYQQDPNFKFDKFLCSLQSASYTPVADGLPGATSSHDYMGPTQSTYSTATTPSTNSENPGSPLIPLPSTTVAPTALVPANGSTNISPSTPIIATFGSTISELTIQTFWLKVGGNVVPGTTTVIGGNSVRFTPQTTNLTQGSTYSITGTATCRDSGVLKSVAFGTWSFTVQSSTAGTTLYFKDMSALATVTTERTLTDTEIFTLFDAPKQANGSGVMIAPDPVSGGTRGNVIKIPREINTGGSGFQVRPKLSTRATEVYISWYDFVPSDCNPPKGFKTPGLLSQDRAIYSPGDSQYYSARFEIYDLNDTGQAEVKPYYYTYNQLQKAVNTGVYLPFGEWVELMLYFKINTSGNADGKLKAWMNGTLLEDRSLEWSDTDLGGWEWGYFLDWYGGPATDPSWYSQANQYQCWDNIRIWTP